MHRRARTHPEKTKGGKLSLLTKRLKRLRRSKNYMRIRVICKIEEEKSPTKRRITRQGKNLTFDSSHVQ